MTGTLADYEQTYEQFWKALVEDPDRWLNVDKVKRELHDYYMMMREVSKVYDEVTGGRVTKPNATFDEVGAAISEAKGPQ